MLKAQLLGGADLKRAFNTLGERSFRPAARKGVTAAAQVLAAEYKANVPVRTRSLKKAIGYKVGAKRSKAGYFAVVGARRDNRRAIAQSERDVAAGKRKRAIKRYRRTVRYRGQDITVDPAKYAHLVEYGRRAVTVRTKKVLSDGTVVYGKRVKSVPPLAPLRKALAASKGRCLAAQRQAFAAAARNPGRKAGRKR
jgi:hypothetical protein